MKKEKFSPMLLPNELTGVIIDWEERIQDTSKWLYSHKLDGGRVELFSDGTVKGRSLKEIPSAHIQRMAKDTMLILQLEPNWIIEAEFYSEEMNFSEIMHFFRSEDVTSIESVKKYTKLWDKSKGDPEKGWSFPGRDLEWATTWHDSLKFYAFSFCDTNLQLLPFLARTEFLEITLKLYAKKMEGLSLDIVYIPQYSFEHLDELFQAYDQAIISGVEGLVVTHVDTQYKYGRYTLGANTIFKIKDDAYEWDGMIMGIEEGTIAKEGAEKTINELGRSKTSQLQEDRIPSGLAKGFRVKMEDGQILIVSLNEYNHDERRQLLLEEPEHFGKWIRFKGMQPVKVGGLPRHAMFTNGNIRDDK